MNALLRAAGFSIVALGLLSGCNDDKTTTVTDAGVDDAGSNKALLSGKLGAAVAAAESGSSQAATPKAPGDGPPEAGFFPPGGADKAQPPGAPPKVEVLDEGAEPKVLLTTAPSSEQQVQVAASYRLGQQGTPFEFSLAIKSAKGKDEKVDAPQIVAKVVSIEIPGMSGKLPKEVAEGLEKLKKGLDKLKGSEVRYRLTSDGTMLDVSTSVPKDKDKDKTKDADTEASAQVDATIDLAMRGLLEAMTLTTVPLPPKPVGVGGYWIATDRGTSFGIEVVRYRVFKVQKIEKGQATLTVDTRQYAVKDEIDLGAIAKNQKITVERFDSQGKGTISWVSSQILPATSEVSQRTAMLFGGPPGQPKNGLQVELVARTSAPEKTDKKK
ncbi:MAG: hypothetical protein ABI134_06570 [Byssovorax sp.]